MSATIWRRGSSFYNHDAPSSFHYNANGSNHPTRILSNITERLSESADAAAGAGVQRGTESGVGTGIGPSLGAGVAGTGVDTTTRLSSVYITVDAYVVKPYVFVALQ